METSSDFQDTRPETFYDIQEETTRTILFLTVLMTLMYVSFFWVIYWVFMLYLAFETSGSVLPGLFSTGSMMAVGAGVMVAVTHALVAYFRDIDGELDKLGAQEIDEDDQYHLTFKNILDEMRIASGRREIEGYVIPSKYRTALSLSSRKHTAVVLTEGTISSLDRNELQGVLAHEVAHIAYGDTTVKTFLQNIVSFLDGVTDSLTELAEERNDTSYYTLSFARSRGGGGAILYLVLLLVTGTYELMSRVLSMSISKQREWRADATAVEYSRNPEALASALYRIGFFYDDRTLKVPTYFSHQRLVRKNYESLQIVPVHADRYDDGGWFDRLFHTHPPLKKRIQKLLNMVRVSFEDLESSVTAVKPTDDFPGKRLRASDGTPVADQEFWIEKEGNVSGPVPFTRLFTGNLIDQGVKIGRSESGPMKPLSAFPFFSNLQERKTTSGGSGDCPDCRGPIREERYLGVPVQTCSVCGGVGVKLTYLMRIICRFQTDQEEADVNLDLERFEEVPHPAEQPEEAKQLEGLCPSCGSDFTKSFYTGRTSLIVDVCSVCGYMWFEHREFRIACRLSTKGS